MVAAISFSRNRWRIVLAGLVLTLLGILAMACGGEQVAPTAVPASEDTASPTDGGNPTPTSSASTSSTDPSRGSPAASQSDGQSAAPAVATDTNGPVSSPAPSGATSAPAAALANDIPGPAPLVVPDPDYVAALDSAKFHAGDWKTDFSLHTVPYDEFLSGGVARDQIPPLDDPQFESIEEADSWLEDVQPVVALEVNGEARAYPLAILTWHEIVNDTLGGVPVSVTFCPLCNSAVAFDRRLDGAVLDFGVSGNLRNSDLVMWDRQTESWWQQLTGDGIVGAYAGYSLELVPAQLVSWSDFKKAFPEADVLSRDTGFLRRYGQNPYSGYDRADQSPFLFRGRPDERLLPMERVVALELDGQPLAFPFLELEEERVVHYPADQPTIVVLFQPGTASALDRTSIAESKDVGSTGVFEVALNGQDLSFRAEGDGFVDDQTGSTWNVLGQALSGPLAGVVLTPVVHGNHFWFAWAAFAPDAEVYQGG